MLKRLRDVMASEASAQQRLDRTVKIIALDMVAEVCSVYLRRAGQVLELFATEGLRPEAVHVTRFQPGQGLVGEIADTARPLALSDAQDHPKFAYRPETGEDPYQSFLGVPILRDGRVLGVVVVQNRTRRRYTEEEIEHLETITMVLAELVATGDLVGRDELFSRGEQFAMPARLEGTRINGGLAVGTAVLHAPQIEIKSVIAEDADRELDRLEGAISGMHRQIDLMLEKAPTDSADESRDVLEAYRMVANDRGWIGRIQEAVRSGVTAEAAVLRVRDDTRTKFAQVHDPYLKERLSDFEDLANRLLTHLVGADMHRPAELPDRAILFAKQMGPAELLDYDVTKIAGLVLEEGTSASHVSIVARALDVPVVGRIAGVLKQVDRDDPVLVDGSNGVVVLRPSEDILDNFEDMMRASAEKRSRFMALRDLPAETVDGTRVALLMNAGMLADVDRLEETGAEGIGLFRTEIPFMLRSTWPSVEDQAQIYDKVLDKAKGRPVVFRMLDVGGDKRLPYLPDAGDENPAMGWRAIRMGLDRPALFFKQLKALMVAGQGRDLHIMFPMIASTEEFKRARDLAERGAARCRAEGIAPPTRLSIGAMVEVPALLWEIDVLAAEADFLSVGSNDLQQFMFAADRGAPGLINRYGPLTPAFLAALERLRVAADEADIPVTICGEMAGDPVDAMALLALGFRRLSMSSGSIGAIKAMTRTLDLQEISSYISYLRSHVHGPFRARLKAFAWDHGFIT
ncbi:MAG: phosphoenolpyruvate--protein phosphotransferase [Alphaproteobacteria bacterium]|nr:phosphoenolpyruvate--protein phosphotransferase [Alphaproteobacteria bacterium]